MSNCIEYDYTSKEQKVVETIKKYNRLFIKDLIEGFIAGASHFSDPPTKWALVSILLVLWCFVKEIDISDESLTIKFIIYSVCSNRNGHHPVPDSPRGEHPVLSPGGGEHGNHGTISESGN
jgi:hypothetical protein